MTIHEELKRLRINRLALEENVGVIVTLADRLADSLRHELSVSARLANENDALRQERDTARMQTAVVKNKSSEKSIRIGELNEQLLAARQDIQELRNALRTVHKQLTETSDV